MRESIERVISELEEYRKSHREAEMYWAYDSAYGHAISLLKEVLTTETIKVRSEENDN